MPQFGGASEKCSVCSKTVYIAEKIVVEDKEEKKTFHKTCLKCTHCKATLSLGNYASMKGVMYCKPHFKQLFATKGNYDEGFGKEKLTSKWAPNAPPATSTANAFVPVDKTEEPKPVKDTPVSIASKFQKSTVVTDKCEKCVKTVYATERIVIEEKEGKKVYHKACLRCTHCQVVLTLGNYAAMNGVTYCKPHLKQLFATKGNYDEGFGKEKHTTNWAPQTISTPSTFVPVEKTDSPKESRVATSTKPKSGIKSSASEEGLFGKEKQKEDNDEPRDEEIHHDGAEKRHHLDDDDDDGKHHHHHHGGEHHHHDDDDDDEGHHDEKRHHDNDDDDGIKVEVTVDRHELLVDVDA